MEEFDSNYLAWILYKLFYGIDKEVAKNKERSYVEIDLSNNCKYDVFYNYVKILNLMTLRSSCDSIKTPMEFDCCSHAIFLLFLPHTGKSTLQIPQFNRFQ